MSTTVSNLAQARDEADHGSAFLDSLERGRVLSPCPIGPKEVPLVDRTEEMNVLREAVHKAAHGEGEAMMVVAVHLYFTLNAMIARAWTKTNKFATVTGRSLVTIP
jgi:hypothetical protein